MPFVKFDCGILNSSLWPDKDARDVFITSLLMATPFEVGQPLKQIETRSLSYTGWEVPAGWYGMVNAASTGIIDRCKIDQERGRAALERLASPDPDSRSDAFDGRRMVRVDGGFIVLNYEKYRDRDYTSATRSKRYRDKQALLRVATQSHRDITYAEAEAEAEAEAGLQPPLPPKVVEFPPGFPKTEAQALESSLTLAVPEAHVLWAWNECAARGGKDFAGRSITSWAHFVAASWAREQSRKSERKERQKSNEHNANNGRKRFDRNEGTLNAKGRYATLPPKKP